MAIYDSPVYVHTVYGGQFTAFNRGDGVNEHGYEYCLDLTTKPELDPWLPFNHIHIENGGYQVIFSALQPKWINDRTRTNVKGRTIVEKFTIAYDHISLYSPAVMDPESEITLVLGRKVSSAMTDFATYSGVPLASVMRGDVRNPGKQ